MERLNVLARRVAREQIAEAIRRPDIAACVTGGGSMFRVHFKAERPGRLPRELSRMPWRCSIGRFSSTTCSTTGS